LGRDLGEKSILVRDYKINRVDSSIDFSKVLDWSKGAVGIFYRKDGSFVRGVRV
jgi:hypothetical protein